MREKRSRMSAGTAFGVDQSVDRQVGCDAGDDDRRRDRRAVLEADPGDPAVGRPGSRRPCCAAAARRRRTSNSSAQMRGQRADAAPQLLDQQRVLVGHGEPVRQRRGGAGRRGSAVGGVDREQRQHAAQRAVLLLVGQVAVEHIGDRSEQQVGDRRPLEFVCRAGIHLVERLRRLRRRRSGPARASAPGTRPSARPCR